MNVTREVIYDLLPGYFSGDISPDTRALVDEFLRRDPEFSRMLERVKAAQGSRPLTSAAVPGDREAFERARSWLHRISELRGYVIAFSIPAVVLFVIFVVRAIPTGIRIGPIVIMVGLACVAAVAGVQLLRMLASGPPRRVQ